MQHMTFDSWCEIHMEEIREACQTCRGTGICVKCFDDQCCSSCRGSGECRTCDGEGAIDGVECHKCHGKGYCMKCDGEGVDACPTCDGTGECPKCGTQALRAMYKASVRQDQDLAARWADGRGLPCSTSLIVQSDPTGHPTLFAFGVTL